MKYTIEIQSEGLLVRIETKYKDSAHRFIDIVDEAERKADADQNRIEEEMRRHKNAQ